MREESFPKGSTVAVAHWRVTLGKRITGTKKQRNFFKTYKAAIDHIADAMEARKRQGSEAFDIPQKLRVEAMECQKRLDPYGASITEAVDFYIRANPLGRKGKTFTELCSEFLRSRRAMGCKPRTLVQYESYVSILTRDLGRGKINALKATDIEEWLDDYELEVRPGDAVREMSSRTRRNYLTTLTTIFNYALTKDYIITNPALKVPRPKLEDKQIGILSPREAETLLKVACEEAPEMVPGIACGLFAGLRRSEIAAVDWKKIDLAGKTIVIDANVSKTRQGRVVTVSDNLAKWLQPHAQRSGPIAFHPDVFGEKLRDLVRPRLDEKGNVTRPAVVPEWPHNALRHSFGSYHYEKHSNEGLTAKEMGNSPDIVHKHYRALVKQTAVAQFWKICPKSEMPFRAGWQPIALPWAIRVWGPAMHRL